MDQHNIGLLYVSSFTIAPNASDRRTRPAKERLYRSKIVVLP